MSKSKHHARLKQQFVNRHQLAVQNLTQNHSVAQNIFKKAKQKAKNTTAIITSSVATGALTGALLLSPVNSKAALGYHPPKPTNTQTDSQPKPDIRATPTPNVLIPQLTKNLPSTPRSLTAKEETELERIISTVYKVNATAELDGKRLNTSYGYIGAEQHLPRYPGDTVTQHDELQHVGITPKQGAWGYFASSKDALTEQQRQQEKYYFAVQTFISPGWSENIYELKEWFKYRKVIAVNTKTGDAIVGVVGDAGPAVWTGKQFGGSPEVMQTLKLKAGGKGTVLLFFVDDPNNEIPLGPISY